jgi:SAM-dependent methyltransferase
MREHWDKVYSTKRPENVSWYRAHLETSVEWIERAAGGNRSARIIDVGGGASSLAADLLAREYENLTVLDISQAALDEARRRMGHAADRVHWLCADILQADLPEGHFDIWHDRAVFHFFTRAEDRAAYVRQAQQALRPGGRLIVSTFGPDGPQKCSGLDVARYSAEELAAEFGEQFALRGHVLHVHTTPWGAPQQFLTCDFQLS